MNENNAEMTGTYEKKNDELKDPTIARVTFGTMLEWSKGFASRHQGLVVLVVIFVLAVIFSPVSRKGNLIFLTPGNLTDLLRSMAPVAVMGFAMTMVIITAGIDLSVGSTVALTGVIVAMLLQRWQPGLNMPIHIAIAILLTLLAGAFVGAIQGLIIANIKIDIIQP